MSREYARARLHGADFSDQELAGADFFAASAVNANFNRADLTQAVLCAGNFAHASFIKADLSGARLDGATFYDADLRAADLRGVSLAFTDFEAALTWGAATDRKRSSPEREHAAKAGFPSFGDLLVYSWLRPNRRLLLAMEGVLWSCESLALELVPLLGEHSQSQDALGATALAMRPEPEAIAIAWNAIENEKRRFTPQLIAALRRVDPHFASRATPAMLKELDGRERRWLETVSKFEPTRT